MTTALVLRTCGPDGESYDGFRWPLTVGAEVAAPDWKKKAECGNGLHGWLYGAGDIGAATLREGGKWLVVEVEESTIVMIGGKCKYPKGVVRFVGAMHEAAAFMIEHEPRAKTCAVIGAVLSVGEGGVCAVGALGTATAGCRGTATAGCRGTATAGYRGTATAGDSGTATAGCRGTATAGYRGTIVIEWYDCAKDRYRRAVGYVGEDGIEANVAYRCDDAGKLVRTT
jgi:hypothetical protein